MRGHPHEKAGVFAHIGSTGRPRAEAAPAGHGKVRGFADLPAGGRAHLLRPPSGLHGSACTCARNPGGDSEAEPPPAGGPIDRRSGRVSKLGRECARRSPA
eukprot:scaffold4784_cov388-Prasinococcus_capsulatus_cf.AAC.3